MSTPLIAEFLTRPNVELPRCTRRDLFDACFREHAPNRQGKNLDEFAPEKGKSPYYFPRTKGRPRIARPHRRAPNGGCINGGGRFIQSRVAATNIPGDSRLAQTTSTMRPVNTPQAQAERHINFRQLFSLARAREPRKGSAQNVTFESLTNILYCTIL